LAACAGQKTIPILAAPASQDPSSPLLFFIPVVVKVEAIFCAFAFSLPPSPQPVVGIAYANGDAWLNRGRYGA
jgi:hypothetical protein